MTARYEGDCCPGCGSDDVLPFAFIFGPLELYGYQCVACLRIWPVLQAETVYDTLALRSMQDPAAE